MGSVEGTRQGSLEPLPATAGSGPLPGTELGDAEKPDRYLDGNRSEWGRARFQRLTASARVLPAFTMREEIRIRDGAHHYVDIGHVAVSSGTMLYTNGLWPCVAVAVRNPKTQRALLLHASSDDQASLLRDAVSGLGEGPLEAYIAGGDTSPGSRKTLEALADTLSEQKIPVAGYRPNTGIDSLAINPMTGEVH